MLASEAAADRPPGYVGTWASSPVQCLLDQGVTGAPLIMKVARYDQHEAHCTFASVRRTGGNAWRVDARCRVEGGSQRHAFTIAVDGHAMTLRDKAGARTFIRCP